MSSIPEFIALSTGAFVVWGFKGFKGRLNDQMVSMDQRFTMKWISRIVVGVSTLLIIFLIGNKILSKPEPEPVYHRVELNEKGELVFPE